MIKDKALNFKRKRIKKKLVTKNRKKSDNIIKIILNTVYAKKSKLL